MTPYDAIDELYNKYMVPVHKGSKDSIRTSTMTPLQALIPYKMRSAFPLRSCFPSSLPILCITVSLIRPSSLSFCHFLSPPPPQKNPPAGRSSLAGGLASAIWGPTYSGGPGVLCTLFASAEGDLASPKPGRRLSRTRGKDYEDGAFNQRRRE